MIWGLSYLSFGAFTMACMESELWRGILDQNIIRSYLKVHYIEFVCILSYGRRYALMSYLVML